MCQLYFVAEDVEKRELSRRTLQRHTMVTQKKNIIVHCFKKIIIHNHV
jgi:hypothetical protein